MEHIQGNSFFSAKPRVLVVGCGGTGGYIIRDIARAMKHIPFTLDIQDGDKVEHKNLIRQNFLEQDIGMNKAEVLAARYSSAYGVEIGYKPTYLNSIIGGDTSYHIIIAAVDNNATRKLIDSSPYNIWIDAGNELSNGQAFLGIRDYFRLFDIHPELAEADTHPEEQSCAQRISSGEQSYTINLTAGLIVVNIFISLLLNKKIPYYEVMFNNRNTTTKKLIKDYSLHKKHAETNYASLKQLKEAKDGANEAAPAVAE